MLVRQEPLPLSATLEFEPRELAAVVQSMRRHLGLSLVIIVGCMALAALVSLVLPKSYTADTTLSYDPQMPLIKGGGELVMSDMQRDAEIDAQLSEVTAPLVAQDVARSVDLVANPALRRAADKWAANSERKLTRDEALGAALLAHVKVRRVGQAPVFTISYTAASAAQAAAIANDFAASYLRAAARQKAALADGSTRQLASRVAALRQQASATQQRLATFRLANHLLDTPDVAALEQELAALHGQLADAHGQAALAGARSAAADAKTVVGGSNGGAIDTTPVSALIQQRAATAADLAALLGKYGELYPDVIATREKLAELHAQLTEAMRGNRHSAAAEARATNARAQALTGSLEDAEMRLSTTISHDAQRIDLQNNALAAQQEYQDALKINADQIEQRSLIQPDAQQIALALPPLLARSPRLGICLLIGLALGLGVAVAVAFIRDTWLHTLGSVDDIARWLKSDYYAPLPRLGSSSWQTWRNLGTRDPVKEVLLNPQSAIAESFRSLGTAALFAASKNDTSGGRVIGVTSALPGDGKTTACIAMGQVLATAGMKVALVDGDPRGGSEIRALAGRTLTGTALIGQTPTGKSGANGSGARRSGSEAPSHETQGLNSTGMVLFMGGIGPDPARTIAALRPGFDVVIVDIAPMSPGWDIPCLLENIDALVLLARWRSTPVRALRSAMRRIVMAGGRLSGVALSLVEGNTQ